MGRVSSFLQSLLGNFRTPKKKFVSLSSWLDDHPSREIRIDIYAERSAEKQSFSDYPEISYSLASLSGCFPWADPPSPSGKFSLKLKGKVGSSDGLDWLEGKDCFIEVENVDSQHPAPNEYLGFITLKGSHLRHVNIELKLGAQAINNLMNCLHLYLHGDRPYFSLRLAIQHGPGVGSKSNSAEVIYLTTKVILERQNFFWPTGPFV